MKYRPFFLGKALPAVLAIASLVTGCGGSSPDSPNTGVATEELDALSPQIDRAEFSAGSDIPSNPAPDVHVLVTEAEVAQAIYRLTLALPPMPSGVYNCPFDGGIFYTLTFLDASGHEIARAKLDPQGCESGTITATSGVSTEFWAETPGGSSYWKSLAKDLGLPERAIF